MLKIIPAKPAGQDHLPPQAPLAPLRSKRSIDEDTESNLRNGTVYTDLRAVDIAAMWKSWCAARR